MSDIVTIPGRKLKAMQKRLELAEDAISQVGELLIFMSTYDWFWRHTRRVLDEYIKAKQALGGE